MRRFPLAFVLVGLLGLLAAGGAVLGAFQSPSGTYLAVHNGAAETLSADRVVGHYTTSSLKGDVISFDFVAPARVTEVAKGPNGAVKARGTVKGAKATSILEPISALLTLSTFTSKGALYQHTEPAADLAPENERAGISGTYRTTVEVVSGYVVGVFLRVNATQDGQQIKETLHFTLTRVGDWVRR